MTAKQTTTASASRNDKYKILTTQSASLRTVAEPNNRQNDCLYTPRRPRSIILPQLRTWPTFSKSVMVSVVISKLGCTELIFVESGVKVHGAFTETSCSHNRCCCQSASCPATHLSFNRTVHQLTVHVPQTNISVRSRQNSSCPTSSQPPNSPDLNPTDYRVGAIFKTACTRNAYATSTS